MTPKPLLLTGAALLALAACSSGGSGATATPKVTASVEPGGSITIDGTDSLKFNPSTIYATAGPVTIDFAVPGSTPHEFEIEGVASSRIGLLTSGKSKTITVMLKPGTYTYICAIHQGMVGTLHVSAAQ